jgi:hypothetical protein
LQRKQKEILCSDDSFSWHLNFCLLNYGLRCLLSGQLLLLGVWDSFGSFLSCSRPCVLCIFDRVLVSATNNKQHGVGESPSLVLDK